MEPLSTARSSARHFSVSMLSPPVLQYLQGCFTKFSLYARIALYYNGVNLQKYTEPSYDTKTTLYQIPLRPAAGVVNTGFGCWLYFSSIGALPVQTVSVCGYLEPLSAVFFSVLLLHEALTPARWIGAAMILGGAMLAEFVHAPAKT